MKPIDPGKVAIYIRWSTEDQGEGTTLDVQMEACQAYLRIQGWQFRADLLFIDDGYSGGSLDRPALSRLRSRVRQGEVDCVVCYKLDRLSRSVVDTVNLVLEEWDELCHVKSAREAIDTASQAGKMFFYTLVSYAEWERAVIRERTASGRLRRAQEGRWAAGRPPFGYLVGPDKRLALHAEEAPVVARIFREYLAGQGTGAIAARLNAEGVPFRDKLWRAGAVKRVLENPVYAGELIFGATRANPRYGKRPGEPRNRRADAPAVRIPGGAPAIVSPAEWSAARARRRERDPLHARTGPRAHSSPYLLSALAKCSRCGHSLIGLKRPGCREPVYFCRGHRERGRTCCDGGMVGQPWLDGYVIRAVRDRYGSALQTEQLLAGFRQNVQAELAEAARAKTALTRTLTRLDAEASHLRRLLRADSITPEEYRQISAETAAERTAAHQRLREAEQRAQDLLVQAGGCDSLAAAPQRPPAFEQLAIDQQKTLLGYFIASLRAYKPTGSPELHVEIDWKSASPRNDETESQ